MTPIRDSLGRAAAAAGVPTERFAAVRHPRWEPLLGDILDRFTRAGRKNPSGAWLWADLKEEPTVFVPREDQEPLRVLRSVLPLEQPVWFVAEDFGRTKRRGSYWVFDTDTEAVGSVLSEHHLFEYYVVGRALDWMVAENHHHAFMAVGEPVASRLEALRKGRAET